MTSIKLLAQTDDTVTIRRSDLDALLQAVEDAEDVASVEAVRAHIAVVGWEVAKRDYLASGEARRLIEGEHPVRVWREKRGLSQRSLAEKAGLAAGYLNEIEARKKPGSLNAMVRLAHGLGVTVDDLIDDV